MYNNKRTLLPYFQSERHRIDSEIESYYYFNITNWNGNQLDEIRSMLNYFQRTGDAFEQHIRRLITSSKTLPEARERAMELVAKLIDMSNVVIDMIQRPSQTIFS